MQNNYSIEFAYDAAGLRVERTTSFAHKSEYAWNDAGEIVGVRSGWDLDRFAGPLKQSLPQATMGPFDVKIARDPLGQELARRLPGGVVSAWTRDPWGRATEQRVLTGASTQTPGREVARRAYAWASPEEIASIATLDPASGTVKRQSQYEYDPRGHLIRQLFSDGEVLERQSDAAGNLFRSKDRTDRTYGPGGVIQRANGAEYEVDADGFLIKKTLSDGAVWKYVWDAHGQLTEVVRPDKKKVLFTYDAFGRRTTKSFDGKTTEYVWDGDDLVHERVKDADGAIVSPLTTWVFEPGTFTPLAKVEGRKRYGIVSDHLGSPTMLATEAGKIAWRAQLDVYGVPREEEGVAGEERTENPWRFPGQYEDSETGLYYNRFRYYDPELGRYLSEDPIDLAGGPALYAYPASSLTSCDPFGLSPWAWDPDDGMGHHLVPRRKAESLGWDHLASERNAPTFFPEPYKPGMHEDLHRMQRPHIGPSQGPWTGTGDELLAAARKGLGDFKPKGKLMIPSTKEVLAEGVSATEAFDVLKKWHKKQMRKKSKPCGK